MFRIHSDFRPAPRRYRLRVLLIGLVLLLNACTPSATGNPDLAGNYLLRGVMEMASQLHLQADGRFEAVIAYGSADSYAKGRWTRQGQTLTLRAHSKWRNEHDPGALFREMTLEIHENCLEPLELGGCFYPLPVRRPPARP